MRNGTSAVLSLALALALAALGLGLWEILSISPNKCAMSYMWPNYVEVPLAAAVASSSPRYRLHLYREGRAGPAAAARRTQSSPTRECGAGRARPAS